MITQIEDLLPVTHILTFSAHICHMQANLQRIHEHMHGKQYAS